MTILYNTAFIIFGIAYLPYLIFTKRYRYGMADRSGMLPAGIKSIASKGRVIWIHAVSVGEMKAAGILAPLLREKFPSHTIIFSSVTHTGNKIACSIASGSEGVFYLPFDLSFITDKVVRLIRPELFLSLETELWPNLITSLHRFGAKIVLVNGRISDKSYMGYKKMRFVTSYILKKFSLISAQTARDAERIVALGAPKEKVFITGNLKFDLPVSDLSDKRQKIRKSLNIKDEDILLVAGSTHKGEDESVINSFVRLKKEYPCLRLLIAPRHIERVQEIGDIFSRRGLNPVRYSNAAPESARKEAINSSCVFLLDTIGELRSIYSASDIVFIGGSLVKKGGQNPIEPAILAKPIIIGSFTFNFQDVVRLFVEHNACIEVDGSEALYFAIKFLLDNPSEREKIGLNAKNTVTKNSGSGQRAVGLIASILSNA